VIKHAKALNRNHQPGTNSYKRLVPGFEGADQPRVFGAQSLRCIRDPYVANPKGRRIEVRFPDPTTNRILHSPRC
jgi:glutamine synthetase